ncbi:MAG: hypothetical protein IJ538_03525 [Clostridia bacterium]|nr:hypothetical protein [Clostridia bacterium]
MKNTHKMPFKEVDGEQNTNTNTNNITNILVTKRMRDWIAYNYTIDGRIKEDLIKEKFLNKSLKQLIIDSPLAWKCGKDQTRIAFDLFTYITVIVEKSMPVIVEIKDSHEKVKDRSVINVMIDDYHQLDRLEDEERYEMVWMLGTVNVSSLQRIFSIGYAYAARIVDWLEMQNIITHPIEDNHRKIFCEKETFIAALKKAFMECNVNY